MVRHAIRSAVSAAFAIVTLASASSASAHEKVTKHWVEDDIGPNAQADWSAVVDGVEYLSAHATSNNTGVKVSTTRKVDEPFAYSFTILLKCSDDVPVEVWPEDNIFDNDTTVELSCNPGATLTQATLGLTTITSGHDEGEPGEEGDDGDPGAAEDTSA